MKTTTRLDIDSPQGKHEVLLRQEDYKMPLSDILRREGFPLNTRCGGKGLCDGCLVNLETGRVIHQISGDTVRANSHPLSLRACQYTPAAGEQIKLNVPARSSLRYQPQIQTDYRINVPFGHDPLFPATEKGLLGAAIDIGTTTVVVMLVDLASGEVLARASMFNEQMHLGDDVVTRINLCGTDPTMLGTLQKAVADQTILPLLREACEEAQMPFEQLRCLSISGNTTMLHIFAGVDPTAMGVAPFTPTFLDHRIVNSKEVFKSEVHSFDCHLLPGAGAYVGADLTAGCIATGLMYEDGPSLLVDVGTNGEIILKYGNQLFGCATAAGPAFEGARLSSGMRAGSGAISHIRAIACPFKIEIEVIGNTDKPVGLCGSAYVDFLAQARQAGFLNPAGRFDIDAIPEATARIITHDNHGLGFRVAYAAGQQPIAITQYDISSLLQAKAAIAAGILTLLDQVKLKPSDVKTLYLAGGFGTHLNRANSIGCGLLPGFTESQIQTVGNTALAGAHLALMDKSVLTEIRKSGREMKVVELNLDPNFESQFIDQLMLPEN